MADSSKIIRNRVLAYVAELGTVTGFGKTDLAFSVARKYNKWVTAATAHKYWCAIYDLIEENKISNSDFDTF